MDAPPPVSPLRQESNPTNENNNHLHGDTIEEEEESKEKAGELSCDVVFCSDEILMTPTLHPSATSIIRGGVNTPTRVVATSIIPTAR